jgi:hypothetical protein
MVKKFRKILKFKYKNKNKHFNAKYERAVDNIQQGMENELDIEWGVLPEAIRDMAIEDSKNEEGEGGSAGGGSGGGK